VGSILRLRRHQRDLRDDLDVSARLAAVLARRGIRTLDALMAHSWSDIDSVRGLGLFLGAELDDVLSARGLWLERGRDPVVRLHAATDQERAEPVEALGLDDRTSHVLRAGGVGTVGDLVARTLADVRRIDGVGKVMADEIRHALGMRGLHLAPYVSSKVPPEPVVGDPASTLDALAEHGLIGTRAYIRLHRIGATTVGLIAERSADELMAQDGFGRATLYEVRRALERLGFNLRGDRPRRSRGR
jgi:DNA-directed RNA polymerase alpha subunit